MTAPRRVFVNGQWQYARPTPVPAPTAPQSVSPFLADLDAYVETMPHSCADWAGVDAEWCTDLPCHRCELERLIEQASRKAQR